MTWRHSLTCQLHIRCGHWSFRRWQCRRLRRQLDRCRDGLHRSFVIKLTGVDSGFTLLWNELHGGWYVFSRAFLTTERTRAVLLQMSFGILIAFTYRDYWDPWHGGRTWLGHSLIIVDNFLGKVSAEGRGKVRCNIKWWRILISRNQLDLVNGWCHRQMTGRFLGVSAAWCIR